MEERAGKQTDTQLMGCFDTDQCQSPPAFSFSFSRCCFFFFFEMITDFVLSSFFPLHFLTPRHKVKEAVMDENGEMEGGHHKEKHCIC